MKAMYSITTLPNNSRNVKRTIIYYFLLTVTILLLGSCKTSDDSDIIFEEIIDGQELTQSILDKRNEALQNFSLDADIGGEIQGAEGTILNFGPNAFIDENGDPVTGNITIELIEIYDKAKMLLTKMPTNGKRPNGDIETLISGGEFYINAKQDEEQLELANGFLLFAPADQFDDEMRLFNGQDNGCNQDDLECDIVWEEQEQGGLEPMQREGPNGIGVTGYGGFASNFGWTNIDRWYNDPRPKTILYVDPPAGYDDTYSNVYISYDGEPTALALLDMYNPDTGLFSEHYGLIPIGLEVHFIFVSVQNGEYVYAIQGATIAEDHVEVIADTSVATEAELVALINALP